MGKEQQISRMEKSVKERKFDYEKLYRDEMTSKICGRDNPERKTRGGETQRRNGRKLAINEMDSNISRNSARL